MSAPTQVIGWATSDVNNVDPGVSLKSTGWPTDAIVTSGNLNWMLWGIGLWIQYLAGLLNETLQIPGTDFVAYSGTIDYTAAWPQVEVQASQQLLASVVVPVGRKITGGRAYVTDMSGTILVISLESRAHGGSLVSLAAMNSSGAGGAQIIPATSVALPATIASGTMYYLVAALFTGSSTCLIDMVELDHVPI